MSFWGALAAALGAVSLTLYLRSQQKELSALLCIAASVLLLGFCIRTIGEAADVMNGLLSGEAVRDTAAVLMKALGIAYAAQLTADICREAGETTLASQIELCGKAEIVLLSLPLASRLLRAAAEMLP